MDPRPVPSPTRHRPLRRCRHPLTGYSAEEIFQALEGLRALARRSPPSSHGTHLRVVKESYERSPLIQAES